MKLYFIIIIIPEDVDLLTDQRLRAASELLGQLLGAAVRGFLV